MISKSQSCFRVSIRSFSFVCWAMTQFTIAAAEVQTEAVRSSESYDQGIIFYNGEYIPRPYKISSSVESVFVNDVEIATSIDVPQEAQERQRGREQKMGPRKRQRPRDSQEDSESQKIATALNRSLRDDETVVIFEGGTYGSIRPPSQKYDLYTLLLETDPENLDFEFLNGVAIDDYTKMQWQDWITDYTPPSAISVEMSNFIQMIDDLEAETANTRAASERLESLAYPLTLAGMILSVIAFGQLLQWIGKGFAETDQRKPESERYLKTALLLMLGMSLIDLFWTMLAGNAGVMREVNPVAGLYLNSPIQLAVFKVAATVLGLSIFYVWRQKPIMQQATWWMCLVCVLVTFRWVVFNSMMS